MDRRAIRVQCTKCTSEDVARIYLRTARLDMCRCNTCGYEWAVAVPSGEATQVR